MCSNMIRKTLVTDSGMHGIWDFSTFSDINDYDSWEEQLVEDEDIIKHIKDGHFVPINIYSDGAFEFELRVGTTEVREQLSEREQTYLVVSSAPYRLITNGRVCISGLEYVSNDLTNQVGKIDVVSGTYSVEIYLLAWDEEPGMKNENGEATEEALPDFVVILNPANKKGLYRTKLQTFE